MLIAQVDADTTDQTDLDENQVPPLELDQQEGEDEIPPEEQDQEVQQEPQQQQQEVPQQQQQVPQQQGQQQQTPLQQPQLQQQDRPQQPQLQPTGQQPAQQQTQQQDSQQNAPTIQRQLQVPNQPTQQQQQQQQQQQSVQQQIQQSPIMEERPVTSAPTNVKMSTPLISIDLIMDLYNKDIDFDIEYSGMTGAAGSNLGKKRPSEKDVETMMSSIDSSTGQPGMRQEKKNGGRPMTDDGGKPYTPEDANYNKAMISLNNAQQLFASRRYTEALSEVNRSISFAPNIALSHSVKGSVHYMLRQVSEAKKSWERALELDPTLDNVRAILLRMY